MKQIATLMRQHGGTVAKLTGWALLTLTLEVAALLTKARFSDGLIRTASGGRWRLEQ